MNEKDTVGKQTLVLINTGEGHRTSRRRQTSKERMMAVLLLQGDAKSGNKIHKPPKASSNQDNITLLPFAAHLSCLESLPANAISAAMLGDLPVYSHNQACCLCTPRSFCPRSGMSPRDQTVTAPAPGVLKTFILHSHIIAYESTTE